MPETHFPVRRLAGSHHPVAVIGGGQAGLSVSHALRQRGVEHVVIEAKRVGHEWRERRWDSFCLVTPNWQCRLPGFPYQGDDPDGFMARDEIVRYLEDYVAFFRPPLVEGVSVTRLRRAPQGTYELTTTDGDFTADQVVVATGPYHTPSVPAQAQRLPDGIAQVHSSGYRSPEQLPEGAVLVVGTGQSGCQIAEDLHLAGRQVHLAVGGAPRVARSYRGRDCVAWLDEMGHYGRSIDEFDDADAVRMRVNHYVTGRDGGRDIDLRAFARDGMRLYGRLTAVSGEHLEFADDLKANLDHADAVADGIKDAIDAHITARGTDAPDEARYVPVWEPAEQPRALDLAEAGITSVVWSTGFRRDHRWIEVPVFDGRGYPMHWRGVTNVPGLYFLGLPWQYSWGSGRFEAVGRDAEFLAGHIDASRRLTDVCGTLTGELACALPIG
ncbi:MSMEG_0569 family flavin-dependent oxidoreductase [Streptomyces acidiscabies]|uniref:MSMEG_0569 family flavin-dependent oxidoreductase n=1 Tax=Streptomyces acidiscabies TaxID=42234 RepID=A0AAP6BEX7_9ACTN|nr:MSMEG_0569 family flavin-dependent oxidoreductase [Streptomyces acidiscabies]MBP5942062.1 MSMEG_0569 family flavin-dependent oxidoreductase [Streptomyces sp. LBUM 1476]MBZ3913548.1 MSMEG_0569 family flavin-dependent oxidoreductase [Streptomyces acidiscabies]MDX2963385.1 MSMEG_0569 family flavin-dependent oxidoreductase [Streptomyces acidiscabies]MDX3023119.1 MSMEG_0569 family flavin-dependent oxidoreductase [Streptomyces acidiscabies]MDX3792737.1 MSMEG_0569 family flavin-dependent oxidoredu